MTAACQCVKPIASLNPRNEGKCARCSFVLPPELETRWRNLDIERQFTRDAAKGAVDPTRLIEFSEARAQALSGKYVVDPMMIVRGRDRLRDMREEIADFRNHGVWWQEDNLGTDDDLEHRVQMAQRHAAIAYELLLEED